MFAQQSVGGKTLEQMTMHNERAFDNRMSQLASTDTIFMPYVWMTCQQVSVTQSVGTREYARWSKCVHKFIKKFGQNTACESWPRTLRCIWYPSKVDKVYHCNIFFRSRQACRGRTNTGRIGGAGRRRFPACYVGSARRHKEPKQGLCWMLSKFLLSVFFSVAQSLKSITLRASVDR